MKLQQMLNSGTWENAQETDIKDLLNDASNCMQYVGGDWWCLEIKEILEALYAGLVLQCGERWFDKIRMKR